MGSKLEEANLCGNLRLEIVCRLILMILFLHTEKLKPFHRKIHSEELWLYKNPRTSSYVSPSLLWLLITLIPTVLILSCYAIKKNRGDCWNAGLSLSLALGINGVITNTIKLLVGRPRPDFFWRCFPDGHSNEDMNCTGNAHEIDEGFKSFPSGHSSLAFASMGFTFFYLAGKLHTFSSAGRGRSWRLCLSLFPLFLAAIIAVSRTVDYHHHWQDIVAGSCLGLIISYACYYQYYPSVSSERCDEPLMIFKFNGFANSNYSPHYKHSETVHCI